MNGFTSAEKSAAGVVPLDKTGAAAVVERNIPQPAEDQAIGGEMSRLRTLIKNHVQSYYHSNPVGPTVANADQGALGIVAVGNMPVITSTLATLLTNPSTRTSAIRLCIAWTAISRIDLSCEPGSSFLPPEVARILTSMTGMRDDPQSKYSPLSETDT